MLIVVLLVQITGKKQFINIPITVKVQFNNGFNMINLLKKNSILENRFLVFLNFLCGNTALQILL